MQRKACIHALASVIHIIVRGIERRQIFKNDQDLVRFLEKLGDVLREGSAKLFCLGGMTQRFEVEI
jgi:hypothetical protein